MSQLTDRSEGGSPSPDSVTSGREHEIPLATPAGAVASDRVPAEPGSDAERVASLYARARAHSDAGEDSAAVTAYRQLLKIDPRHVRARNNLALLLERRGNVHG